jgi:hypothetical protein
MVVRIEDCPDCLDMPGLPGHHACCAHPGHAEEECGPAGGGHEVWRLGGQIGRIPCPPPVAAVLVVVVVM